MRCCSIISLVLLSVVVTANFDRCGIRKQTMARHGFRFVAPWV